jgi:hypothetical protein
VLKGDAERLGFIFGLLQASAATLGQLLDRDEAMKHWKDGYCQAHQ